MAHWRDFMAPVGLGGRFLPWKEVARATGLGRTAAWRLQKRGDFPARTPSRPAGSATATRRSRPGGRGGHAASHARLREMESREKLHYRSGFPRPGAGRSWREPVSETEPSAWDRASLPPSLPQGFRARGRRDADGLSMRRPSPSRCFSTSRSLLAGVSALRSRIVCLQPGTLDTFSAQRVTFPANAAWHEASSKRQAPFCGW